MIKFIACDIDGTMLSSKESRISLRLLDNIAKIVGMGIVFAPASGRQYPTMRKLFGDIRDELMYICENGALVVYKGDILSKRAMNKDVVIEIAKDVYSMPNCEFLISGKDISYLKPKTRIYFDRIHKKIKNNIHILNSIEDIDDDIIKVACCDLSGIVNSKDHFLNKWGNIVQTAVSGELYVDFTCTGVNKGNAIKEVAKNLCIKQSEIMAFGDSYNDIEMLSFAEHSYAMENAQDDVKRCAKYTVADVNDILEKIINGEII